MKIYSLARELFLGGQPSFQIQAYPFRMTPTNLARHRTNPHMAFWKMLKIGNDHFEATHLEPKVDVCDRHYVFDAQQPPKGSTPLTFDPTGKCPAFVVNPQIARAALGKQHADEVQYAQLVKANVAVAPIHSGLDGGMNRVFLAQVGGTIPPARVPPGSQLPPPSENNRSLTSRLLGLFGWKSAPQTQVASADSTTLERGAHSAATGRHSSHDAAVILLKRGATTAECKAFATPQHCADSDDTHAEPNDDRRQYVHEEQPCLPQVICSVSASPSHDSGAAFQGVSAVASSLCQGGP